MDSSAAVLALIVATLSLTLASLSKFDRIQGRLCIADEFKELLPELSSRVRCAALCSTKPFCQAFTWDPHSRLCTLFVFDKCSKNVMKGCNSGCATEGPVFIKRRSGLPPGQLCPWGYDKYSCGVRYRVYVLSDGSWDTGRAICESEAGLVIMADITDANENAYLQSIVGYSGTNVCFLSGIKVPGGTLGLADGWTWSSCNSSFIPVNWGLGEPNGVGDAEQVIGLLKSGLIDIQKTVTAMYALLPVGVICECLSPF